MIWKEKSKPNISISAGTQSIDVWVFSLINTNGTNGFSIPFLTSPSPYPTRALWRPLSLPSDRIQLCRSNQLSPVCLISVWKLSAYGTCFSWTRNTPSVCLCNRETRHLRGNLQRVNKPEESTVLEDGLSIPSAALSILSENIND